MTEQLSIPYHFSRTAKFSNRLTYDIGTKILKFNCFTTKMLKPLVNEYFLAGSAPLDASNLSSPSKQDSSTLRAPADPFARSAVSQRSLLAAQFSRSAVSVLPSKMGRAQGWAKGPMQKAQGQRAQGTKGPFGPFGPRGPSGPWAPSGPKGGRVYARNANPNGIDNAQRKLFRMESV